MIITINNFEKFNPRKDQRNFTWFRFNNDFFSNENFIELTDKEKLAWIYILCQASQKMNSKIKINFIHCSKIANIKKEEIVSCVKKLELNQTIIIHNTDSCNDNTDSCNDCTLRTNERTNDTNEHIAQKDRNPSEQYNKVSFDYKTGEFDIPDLIISSWEEAYPAIDLDKEIKKAASWLLSNPKKKKKDFSRFLNSWLGRTQEKGGYNG